MKQVFFVGQLSVEAEQFSLLRRHFLYVCVSGMYGVVALRPLTAQKTRVYVCGEGRGTYADVYLVRLVGIHDCEYTSSRRNADDVGGWVENREGGLSYPLSAESPPEMRITTCATRFIYWTTRDRGRWLTEPGIKYV